MSTQTPKPDVTKEIVIGGKTYELTFDVTNVKAELKDIVIPPQPPVDPNVPKPDSFNTIKEGKKWSKNPGSADTWKLVPMKDNPDLFKFISAIDELNIIADIPNKEQAEALRSYFSVNVFPPKHDGGTIDPQEPEKPPVDPQPIPQGELPYKVGKSMGATQRGPTKRHYASNNPDDWTIEKNIKGIPYPNHLAVFDITVNKEMEHDDNLSIKIGGDHNKNGWFDNGISIYEGQSCLGTEVEHPKTKKCLVQGKKYGDLRGKRLQVASSFFVESNKTEYWVNIPGVTQGWDKAVEGTDVGGFNSKTNDNFEVQLRIDGFPGKDNPPEIHSAAVYEILS